MVRGMLLVALALATLLLVGLARAQDESSAGDHAMTHAHSAAEHGGHTHSDEEPSMEEDTPRETSQNFLMWLISALGWKYVLLLLMSALLSFALTAMLVIAGKGRTTGAALGFIVAIPLLIGIFGMFDGMIAGFMVIAHSPVTPKPSQLAHGISTSIVTPLVGMLLMVPSYLLATAGLTIRALKNDLKP